MGLGLVATRWFWNGIGTGCYQVSLRPRLVATRVPGGNVNAGVQ